MWRWWWRRENNRNVVVAVVVLVVLEENNIILWPEILCKCSTFFLFLSLHSAPEELIWVGSVPFAKNPLVEKIVCKGTWCLHTARLVSPHFKQCQCFHRNVSGFALSILSPPLSPKWPCPEKRPGSISIATSFRDHLPFPGEDPLVLFTMAARVYRNASRHATHWIRQGNSYGFGAGCNNDHLFCREIYNERPCF